MNAVCTIFRNEAPHLREWIQFHRLQGFQRFHLYNNESTDDWMPEVFDLISQGIVTIHDWPGEAQQLPMYRDFLIKCKHEYKKYKWVGFFDIDEYMYCRSGRRVDQVIRDYNQYAAIEAQWIIFGTSGHKKRPEGLTIDNYTMRSEFDFEDNVRHVKSIVKPIRVCNIRDPHEFEVFGSKVRPADLRINHYWSRSEEDLHHKYTKGRPDIPERHSMDTVNRIVSSTSAVKDETIKNFWSEPLRKSL